MDGPPLPTGALEFEAAAADLIDKRKAILNGQLVPGLAKVSEKGAHIDAGLTDDGVLLITGSNSVQDYAFYNFRPWRPIGQPDGLAQLVGASPKIPSKGYHRGFLLHAARVVTWLGQETPTHIVGHSLGAAAAQILGTALRVPTLCFASPQVVKRWVLRDPAFQRADHPQWNVFNVTWDQDLVTKGFRHVGLRSLGYREVIDMDRRNPFIDHFLNDYKDLLAIDTKSPNRRVPPYWPHPSRPVQYA